MRLPDTTSSMTTRDHLHTASADRSRTLSVEMAARPGGLFATKVHFKHLTVATSEGYANPRELHQTGEKPQVARSRQRSSGLRAYYDLAS